MNYDITFCSGKSCPKKSECRRYLGQPIGDKYIARFVDIPWDSKKKKCEYYLPTDSREIGK